MSTTHQACPTHTGQWFHTGTGACSCGIRHGATPHRDIGTAPWTRAERALAARFTAGDLVTYHGVHGRRTKARVLLTPLQADTTLRLEVTATSDRVYPRGHHFNASPTFTTPRARR